MNDFPSSPLPEHEPYDRIHEFYMLQVFDERERIVLEYAEAATESPARVPDELAARLHAHFDEAEIVELAAWVALENFRSRFNAGLGLRSQGFAERCAVPPPNKVHDSVRT